MRRWIENFSLSVSLALFGLAFPQALLAEELPKVDTDYCYGDQCYRTQQQAEAAMRAANPLYADALRYRHSTYEDPPPLLAGSKLKIERLHYGVDDRAPKTLNPPVYTPDFTSNPAPKFCAPANDPIYTNACADEGALV